MNKYPFNLPLYVCRNPDTADTIVCALKISMVASNTHPLLGGGGTLIGFATLYPVDTGYSPIRVDPTYMNKYHPKDGGYYVAHADGHTSWWEAIEFEDVYAHVTLAMFTCEHRV